MKERYDMFVTRADAIYSRLRAMMVDDDVVYAYDVDAAMRLIDAATPRRAICLCDEKAGLLHCLLSPYALI